MTTSDRGGSWLDPFSVLIEKDGVSLPRRRKIELGDGISAVDNPENDSTTLDAAGGGGGGGEGGGGSGVHEVAVYRQGTTTSSEVILRYRFAQTVTWPAGLTGSQFDAATGSTGDVSCTLKKNGASIGYVRYESSSLASITFSSAVTWAAGDILTVVAPSSADATLAGITMTISGTR